VPRKESSIEHKPKLAWMVIRPSVLRTVLAVPKNGNLRLVSLLMFLVLLSAACGRVRTGVSIPDNQKSAVGKTPQKYNLDYVFHTMGVTEGNKIIDAVSIRDLTKGDELTFEPPDQQLLLLGDGYSRNMSWSPDEEYLILPLGQFDGFCIIKSSEALKSIREKNT
jgi:hypothetical protein